MFKWWNSYKYRFSPWMLTNLYRRGQPRLVVRRVSETVVSQQQVAAQVMAYLTFLHDCPRSTPVVDAWRERFGFVAEVGPSVVDSGGLGVVVSAGRVKRGAVVSLYPGLVYFPGEPLLLQSLGNPFVFRCEDGVHIDGNKRGVSRMMYRSCRGRDRLGPLWPNCDETWLEAAPWNPLGIGQIVNNETRRRPANVQYVECDFPLGDLQVDLFRFLPNNTYSPRAADWLRIVGVVATRDIEAGEEVLSSYFTLVDQDKCDSRRTET